MFIGHYAVALAAKRVAPRASLGTLFASAQLVDLLWPFFLLLGWERVRIAPGITAATPLDFESYPITHSLVGATGWALAGGLLYFAWRRERRAALVVGLLVLSHWLLDLVVHRPDLPIVPGGARYGLGLWDVPVVAYGLEALLFAGGLALFLRATEARDRIGRAGVWGLCGLLVLLWVANALGPPPPNARVLALSALVLWLFVPLAAWVDRHRRTRVASG